MRNASGPAQGASGAAPVSPATPFLDEITTLQHLHATVP